MPEKTSEKRSVYLPIWMMAEIQAEQEKFGVSFSKIMQDCVNIARQSKTKKPKGIVAYLDGPAE